MRSPNTRIFSKRRVELVWEMVVFQKEEKLNPSEKSQHEDFFQHRRDLLWEMAVARRTGQMKLHTKIGNLNPL